MARVTFEPPQQSLDQRKLKALIHYICYQCHDPSVLGATNLNKILWYSDVIAFARAGASITGETYVKQQFGPVPRHILGILKISKLRKRWWFGKSSTMQSQRRNMSP